MANLAMVDPATVDPATVDPATVDPAPDDLSQADLSQVDLSLADLSLIDPPVDDAHPNDLQSNLSQEQIAETEKAVSKQSEENIKHTLNDHDEDYEDRKNNASQVYGYKPDKQETLQLEEAVRRSIVSEQETLQLMEAVRRSIMSEQETSQLEEAIRRSMMSESDEAEDETLIEGSDPDEDDAQSSFYPFDHDDEAVEDRDFIDNANANADAGAESNFENDADSDTEAAVYAAELAEREQNERAIALSEAKFHYREMKYEAGVLERDIEREFGLYQPYEDRDSAPKRLLNALRELAQEIMSPGPREGQLHDEQIRTWENRTERLVYRSQEARRQVQLAQPRPETQTSPFNAPPPYTHDDSNPASGNITQEHAAEEDAGNITQEQDNLYGLSEASEGEVLDETA